MRTAPTVVVLTALEVEYAAVRALLNEPQVRTHPAGTRFEVGRAPHGRGSIVLVLCGQGNQAAAVLAERAIATFTPQALLFVGVAGALHDDLEPGDVVVATKIYSYHGGKDEDEGFHARPQAWEAPHELDQTARHIARERTWTAHLRPPPERQPPVHFRPMAAGEVVLNSRNTPLAAQLRTTYDDAAAIEMESAGAAKAGHLNRRHPVLTIRGISDKADGYKHAADAAGWQPIASAHAAAFAITLATDLLYNSTVGQGRADGFQQREVTDVLAHIAGTGDAATQPSNGSAQAIVLTGPGGVGGPHTSQGTISSLPVPRQLPAGTTHFTSRETHMAELTALLSIKGSKKPGVVVVSAIAGMAGVGKTALAVQWAHQVRSHFPDGDLFVNLRGYDHDVPVDPGQALDGFLRAFDVPAEKIPVDVPAQAALYRTLLAGRRVLIVLDNAASAKQVRPLLPASPTCLVVVTSRSRLSGLTVREGAGLMTLDVLPPAEALTLLRRIIGRERFSAEPDSARELIRLCARLPLAIRIAGERITARSNVSLAELVGELADEKDRIDALSSNEDDTVDIRAVFSWSYQCLPPQAARMFRMLGLHTGPEISTGAAAALTDTTTIHARRLLDSLDNGHLITRIARDRYRFHDLLRSYAADRAEEDEAEEERNHAIRRVLAWYLYGVEATDRAFAPKRRRVPLELPKPARPTPSFSSRSEALEWCEAERANLIAATRQAAKYGLHAATWQYSVAMGEFLFQRKYWMDWLTTHNVGLEGARHINDRVGEGWMLTNLGLAHVEMRQFEEAVDHCQRAIVILREIGDFLLEGLALTNLGLAFAGLLRFNEANDCYKKALVAYREVGSRWGEAWALTSLGLSLSSLRRFEEAVDHYEQALQLHRDADNTWAEGVTLTDLGMALVSLDRFNEATDVFRRAISVHGTSDNPWGKASTLTALGDALHSNGKMDAAREHWRQALSIYETLGAPAAQQVDEINARLDTREP